MSTSQQSADFMILGPAMGSGSMVLQAIHALYFLPENFKLVLTGSQSADQSFYKEVKTLVERDGLGKRVAFEGNAADVSAIILPRSGLTRSPNTVSGDSPEALASAILKLSRA